ncbi:hypothetical protein ACT4XR_20280 (plasmid) [Acinetobacter baumannii]|uniref:hypothetical protein n=1 Tax=Acinetobacter baumannii TaxID=470 RepID=UPI003891C02A
MNNIDRYIEMAAELSFYQSICWAVFILTYVLLMVSLVRSSRKQKAYRKQNYQLMMCFSSLFGFALFSTLLMS